MKNEKGFTLVELLAIIILLAIVGSVGLTITLRSLKNAKEKAKYIAAKDIVEIASAYLLKNDIKDEECVSIKELTDNKYIDDSLINPRTNDLKWNSNEKNNTQICVCENCSAQDNYSIIQENEKKLYKFDGYDYEFADEEESNNSNVEESTVEENE